MAEINTIQVGQNPAALVEPTKCNYTSLKPRLSCTKDWVSTTNLKNNNLHGEGIWSDGDNLYYSYNTYQLVLIKEAKAWTTKTWSGYTQLYGEHIWSDGDNIYYSNGSTQKVLNKSTSTWSNKTWSGVNPLGKQIWSDGDNIYYSASSTQKVLNKSTSTWSNKTWYGFAPISGEYVWSDGNNIYYSNDIKQYKLDKSTSTWTRVSTWPALDAWDIWTDGENIYYSKTANSNIGQYVFNKTTQNWETKTWNGFQPTGYHIWTDGENIYYSYNGSGSSTEGTTGQYILYKQKTPKIPETSVTIGTASTEAAAINHTHSNLVEFVEFVNNTLVLKA